jgi:F-type H+-transporting ATPase subunit delta
MAQTSAIARPYGLAAFKQAGEEGKVAEWAEMLELLVSIVRDPTMRGLIANPKVRNEQLAALIIDISGDRLPETGRNLVRLLAENERLGALQEIAGVFNEERARAEGRSRVDVTSAFELSAEQQRSIEETMGKRLGTKVDVSVSIDDSLIGGIIIRAGDLVIDASFRGRLIQLGQALG